MKKLLLKWLSRLQNAIQEENIPALWINSSLTPQQISEKMGLIKIGLVEDCENYWEWTVGFEKISGIRLDVYRTHRIEENEKTEVFFARWDDGAFFNLTWAESNAIAAILAELKLGPVFYGPVSERYHNDFQAEIITKWENSP